MKPRFPGIFTVFSTLLLFLLAGCATGQKAYDGPKLPDDRIARIICKSRPVEIETMWAKAGTGQFTNRGWRVDPGFFAKSWTLEVLPGKYIIHFEVPDGTSSLNPPAAGRAATISYGDVKLSQTLYVAAGRVYSIECDKKSKRCSVAEVNPE